MMIACQSTEPVSQTEVEEDNYTFKTNIETPVYPSNISINTEDTVNEVTLPPLPGAQSSQSLPPNDLKAQATNAVVTKNTSTIKASTFLNKEVCRDNVQVTYKVTDQNGVTGVYKAKVQAQGIIVLISEDRKHIKLRATGWYTQNENLYHWQPYLKNPPIAKDISIAKGSEYWDEVENWYLCGAIKA